MTTNQYDEGHNLFLDLADVVSNTALYRKNFITDKNKKGWLINQTIKTLEEIIGTEASFFRQCRGNTKISTVSATTFIDKYPLVETPDALTFCYNLSCFLSNLFRDRNTIISKKYAFLADNLDTLEESDWDERPLTLMMQWVRVQH